MLSCGDAYGYTFLVANRSINPQLQVAKVTAFQAVIVAVITAAGGAFAGYMSRSAPQPVKQHWLIIHKVETNSLGPVRVLVNVNGINLSYPSKSVWAEVGPEMSTERLPLPATADRFNISFEVLAENDPSVRGLSQQVRSFEVDKLPSEIETYELFAMYGSSRGVDRGSMKIVFSLQ